MENLFNFEYEVQTLLNKDNTKSNYQVVFGDGGRIMHCKKDSYQLITTNSLSMFGNTFMDKGNQVKSFIHRNGEVIGLNINLGEIPTKVGDKTYNALITIPNNGGGRGYLSIKENRLICTNGAVHTLSSMKENTIKIPHSINYNDYLGLMEESLIQFQNIITYIEVKENELIKNKLENHDVLFLLNRWFYENEMPTSHKGDLGFNDFRRTLVESPNDIKCIDRYNQLMKAYQDELEYNTVLKLELSKYTVIATINNYISRRIEKSNSTADLEIQFSRQADKVNALDLYI